jgi:hypothetical protein
MAVSETIPHPSLLKSSVDQDIGQTFGTIEPKYSGMLPMSQRIGKRAGYHAGVNNLAPSPEMADSVLVHR